MTHENSILIIGNFLSTTGGLQGVCEVLAEPIGVFRHLCPGIELIPARTDFCVTDRLHSPWYHELTNLISTPQNLVGFSEAKHEHFGIAYYWMRGGM